MDAEAFASMLHDQFRVCEDVLTDKRREYATKDVLHNFRRAAELQNISPKAALAGMMVKHTVSLYDMCHSDEEFTIERWEEKIIDHINYLFLLNAIILDECEMEKFSEVIDTYLKQNEVEDA